MTMGTNSLSTVPNSEVPHRPVPSFRSLRWLNGGVHWISAVVLVYAFISNGETTHAMIDPVAMRGEVKLGLGRGPDFSYPAYLGAKQALRRREVVGIVGSNPAL